jgi:hypothetical protein
MLRKLATHATDPSSSPLGVISLTTNLALCRFYASQPPSPRHHAASQTLRASAQLVKMPLLPLLLLACSRVAAPQTQPVRFSPSLAGQLIAIVLITCYYRGCQCQRGYLQPSCCWWSFNRKHKRWYFRYKNCYQVWFHHHWYDLCCCSSHHQCC